MKETIKQWLGPKAMSRFRLLKRYFKRQSMGADLETTFTRIYRENHWGGETGALCSGDGSSLDHIVEPYVQCVRTLLEAMPADERCVVDLGCGDFQVGRRYVDLCGRYTGVDIVADVVERNQRAFGSDHVSFHHLDITRDPLPEGRVCLIRQVLQHLSNQQICTVLDKLASFDLVLITEHYPKPAHVVRKNVDKPAGAEVRALYGSGVYFDAPPFARDGWQIEKVLEVEGSFLGADVDPGLIVTYAIRH